MSVNSRDQVVDKQQVLQRMCESGLLPVFRTDDVEHLCAASRAYFEAGVGCVEYTMTMPDALRLIRDGVAALPEGAFLGAGTVLNGSMVDRAVEAGASFIAGPGTKPEVINACRRNGVLCVAGAVTPTEIMQALDLGADVIKVFPAVSVGPRFLAEVLGPFPDACLMAAGGISLTNIPDFIAAGARIVTCLANGLDAAAYASGDCAAISRAAARWLEAIATARQASKARQRGP